VIVSDPNHQEESVMSGKMVLGVNPYREICTLHLAGQMLIDKVKRSLFWHLSSCRFSLFLLPLHFFKLFVLNSD
jgi:exosome complex RNA-binding protein Rrp42 (RNase PH superfamily)